MDSITLILLDKEGRLVCTKLLSEARAEKLSPMIVRQTKFYLSYDESAESNIPTLVYKETSSPSVWSRI